jgi:hypothetical protein
VLGPSPRQTQLFIRFAIVTLTALAMAKFLPRAAGAELCLTIPATSGNVSVAPYTGGGQYAASGSLGATRGTPNSSRIR